MCIKLSVRNPSLQADHNLMVIWEESVVAPVVVNIMGESQEEEESIINPSETAAVAKNIPHSLGDLEIL